MSGGLEMGLHVVESKVQLCTGVVGMRGDCGELEMGLYKASLRFSHERSEIGHSVGGSMKRGDSRTELLNWCCPAPPRNNVFVKSGTVVSITVVSHLSSYFSSMLVLSDCLCLS